MSKQSKKSVLVFIVLIATFCAFVTTIFLFITDAKRLHQKGELRIPIKRPGNLENRK